MEMKSLPQQTADSVWKEEVSLLNPVPCQTPPQPTGLFKLFELRL